MSDQRRPSAAHLTIVRSNHFAAATMLRQVALVRDYGPSVQVATHLVSCDGCDWTATATSHAEQIAVRLVHEKGSSATGGAS